MRVYLAGSASSLVRMVLPRGAAVLACLLLSSFGGCANPPTPMVPPQDPPTTILAEGCREIAKATVHLGGGENTSTPPLEMRPCFSPTGLNWTYEPTIGILSNGTVLVAPARTEPIVFRDGKEYRCHGVARSDPDEVWRVRYPLLAQEQETCFTSSTDPFVYVDPATDRVFSANWYQGTTFTSVSDDAGDTWQTTTVSGLGQVDHEMVFAGRPRISPTMGYPNVVYHCAYTLGGLAAASYGFSCAKSLDGGRTFIAGSPTPYPGSEDGNFHVPGNCAGGLDHGVAEAAGRLYIPTTNCGIPWLAMSDDEGLTWTFAEVSTKQSSRAYVGFAFGWSSVAVDRNGDIYYLWVADDLLPWLARSFDGGATWSEPIMVAAPGVTEAALVQVVAGDAGKVALSYLGSQNAPGFQDCPDPTVCVPLLVSSQSGGSGEPPGYENVTWDAYMAILPDAAATNPAIHSMRVSGDGSDPVIRGPCGPTKCVFVSGEDYVDARIGPDGSAFAVFVDRCLGPCSEGGTTNSHPSEAQAVVARLLEAPNLWGNGDPNGPYPG
jgi:hypothetical protein